MRRNTYSVYGIKQKRRSLLPLLTVALPLLAIASYGLYTILKPASPQEAASSLVFDQTVTETERTIITRAIQEQKKSYDRASTASVETLLTSDGNSRNLAAYVFVMEPYAVRQAVAKTDLASSSVSIANDTDPKVVEAIALVLGLDSARLQNNQKSPATLGADEILIMPVEQLSSAVKLLTFDNKYYLDSFTEGAIFRQARFSGDAETSLADLKLNDLPSDQTVLTINQSGVTALTRVMQRKLSSVNDPLYFSAKIGDFLADADLTHVSNEVSFRAGCAYSNVLFCSPPEFIETLKDSGVDLVEITGNHNNDNGSQYNTETIELYRSLGWNVFGGGLNAEDAKRPYLTDLKGNKVAFIGYNRADGAGSGAIAGPTNAGANFYTREKAESDIRTAKQAGYFVMVHIQYAECQAYPTGYVEFPLCDQPIGGQVEAFKEMVELGADMVIGSSAHQPQTFEFYKGKAIYYGLGNLYFDQYQWPGTERGIILTQYLRNGALLQTKLTPTVYDRELQTRIMDADEANYLLTRLKEAREP